MLDALKELVEETKKEMSDPNNWLAAIITFMIFVAVMKYYGVK